MKKTYDIIIAGGGTAGMTAAIYGYRSGKSILIIEKGVFGGQIITTSEIENYPGFSSIKGYSFASELYRQINAMNIDKINDEIQSAETKNNFVTVHGAADSYYGKTIIIAVGTKNRTLGLPGEEKLIGHGLSYCATCDGAFYKNQTVAVVGGGNNALEEALYLSLICEKVYLIHRSDEFSGEKTLQERVFDSNNIELLFNTQVIGIRGENSLKALEILTESPKNPNKDLLGILDVTGLFIAIGQIPQNMPFADIADIDKYGYVIANESCHTKRPYVFAAGDCRTKELRQLVTAASDGAIAASEAVKLLNTKNTKPADI